MHLDSEAEVFWREGEDGVWSKYQEEIWVNKNVETLRIRCGGRRELENSQARNCENRSRLDSRVRHSLLTPIRSSWSQYSCGRPLWR